MTDGKFCRALPYLYVTQLALTITLLGLDGGLINGRENHHPRPIFCLTLATSVTSLLSLVSFVLAFRYEVFRHPAHIWLANAFNLISTFSAAVILSYMLGVHDCSDLVTTPQLSLFCLG